MKPSSKLRKEKIESKNILKKLKSDYFLQKLFNNLLKRKSLDIIKYNKNIKNRINISIKDYKEYAEIYSPIEIEIKLVNNEYGEFINVEKENEKYYHIYFDDNKEEIKRFYLNENENIEKIKVIINYQIKTFEYLFEDCGCIEYIYFKKFYRNNINNMKSMFEGCSSLKELNLSNFNTNNVIDMSHMFYNCSSLKELNVSNFNTNNVTDMRSMFFGCSSLKELNISNFNTNKVNVMEWMFFRCSSLKELNLPNNFNNDTDMLYMFNGCSKHLRNKIRAQYKNLNEGAFQEYYIFNE